MRILLVSAAIFSTCATSASAQVTRCDSYGGQTTCRTVTTGSLDGDGTAIGTFNKLFKPNPRKKVGKLLAAGDCEGAKKAALEAGEIDLAQQVIAICSAK